MRKSLVVAAVISALPLLRKRYDWHGRVVLIVGGSRGLGLLLARRFGRKGARLVLAARDGAELERAKESLARRGIESHVITADVGDEAQAFAMVNEAATHYGRLDVLVNAASIISVAPLNALSLEDIRDAVNVNFWGTVYGCWAALPHLEAAKNPRIVNISSIGGVIAVPHLLPYSCGKFATTGFSEGLQLELAPRGIKVVTIIPFLMRTGSAGHALVKGQRETEGALFNLVGSLPLLSMRAERAADRIVRATERGERYVTVGALGKVARLIHSLAPGLSGVVLGSVAGLLPSAPKEAASEGPTEAREHPSAWTDSFLTALGRRAASRNNEDEGIANM